MKKMDKKPLIAIILIALIGVIGGTIAIFTKNVEIPNIFKVGVFKNTVTETFTSPDDWTPGTTTPKTIAVSNDGTIPIVVRAYYVEKWTSKNGEDLSLTKNDKPLVTVNLDHQDSWTIKEEDDKTYYYYKYVLNSGDSIESFIKSVTFNEDTDFTDEIICNKVENDGKISTTCSSDGNGYLGATYTLTIHVDIVQYDGYDTEWTNTDFVPVQK